MCLFVKSFWWGDYGKRFTARWGDIMCGSIEYWFLKEVMMLVSSGEKDRFIDNKKEWLFDNPFFAVVVISPRLEEKYVYEKVNGSLSLPFQLPVCVCGSRAIFFGRCDIVLYRFEEVDIWGDKMTLWQRDQGTNWRNSTHTQTCYTETHGCSRDHHHTALVIHGDQGFIIHLFWLIRSSFKIRTFSLDFSLSCLWLHLQVSGRRQVGSNSLTFQDLNVTRFSLSLSPQSVTVQCVWREINGMIMMVVYTEHSYKEGAGYRYVCVWMLSLVLFRRRLQMRHLSLNKKEIVNQSKNDGD